MSETSDEERIAEGLHAIAQAHEAAIPHLMRLWMECGQPAQKAQVPATPVGTALAVHWTEGVAMVKSRKAGVDAMRHAADADCLAACEYLADLDILIDRESDVRRARAYGKKAAILGRSEALVKWLLRHRDSGRISSEEFEREIEWASGHDPETCYYVADYFSDIKEVAAAQRWVDRALHGGSIRAHWDKGFILWDTRRKDEAVEMWRRGADRGDAACAAELLDLFHHNPARCENFILKEQVYADLVLKGLHPFDLHLGAQTLMEDGRLVEALLAYTLASHFENDSDDEDNIAAFPRGWQLALMFYPDKEGRSPMRPAWDWAARKMTPSLPTETLIWYDELWEEACGPLSGNGFSDEWVQHYASTA